MMTVRLRPILSAVLLSATGCTSLLGDFSEGSSTPDSGTETGPPTVDSGDGDANDARVVDAQAFGTDGSADSGERIPDAATNSGPSDGSVAPADASSDSQQPERDSGGNDARYDAVADTGSPGGDAAPDATADGSGDGSAQSSPDASGDAAIDTGADSGPPISCSAPTACSGAMGLSSVNGDTGANTDVTSGNASAWYVVDVVDTNGWGLSDQILVRITLQSPSGADFDLYAYESSGTGSTECSTVAGSSTNGPGQIDSVELAWNDVLTTDDSKNVTIEVRARSGDVCLAGATWTLTVTGNK